MELSELFEKTDLPVKIEQTNKNRCRNCKHIYQHEYGNMKYCNKQFDKKTAYGNKKIKANQFGCNLFEHK